MATYTNAATVRLSGRWVASYRSQGRVRAATTTRFRSARRSVVMLALSLLHCALPACGPVDCPPGTTLDGDFCVRDGSAAARARSPGSAGSAAGAMAAVGGAGKPMIANTPFNCHS
jgi:hypothetical protein